MKNLPRQRCQLAQWTHMHNVKQSNAVFLALGSNVTGRWGTPVETLWRAVATLSREGVEVVATSRLYATQAVGAGRQPQYVNAVIAVIPKRSPAALLRLAKTYERAAGRRTNRHWGPRPLDIDIIDFRGQSFGWPVRKRRQGILTLPHPETHRRNFVLRPLLDIAPTWRHPALGLHGRALLESLGFRGRGIAEVAEFPMLGPFGAGRGPNSLQ